MRYRTNRDVLPEGWQYCNYCGTAIPGAAWLKRPEHAKHCPLYEKPKRRVLTIRAQKKNPPKKPVRIYNRIREIVATKGPGHPCDAACRRAHHTYIHKFSSSASVWGMPDGSLVVK